MADNYEFERKTLWDIRYVKLHFQCRVTKKCLMPVNKAAALRGGMGEMLLSGSPAEVFPQAETIAKAGLRPPQLMTLLTRIQSAGVPLTADDLLARTPEQAARAIERALKMKKGRRGNDAQ